MSLPNLFANLQPSQVWAHFSTLCEIPRSSYHEAALREHLIRWAHAKNIETCVDRAGNLMLRKPASLGFEKLPGVILQGHLDMVCQANAGTLHDFERDPIQVQIREGWVVADDTTLGADNGIGVALALAALEDTNLIHPPLEVLLTINEESGMDGARGLVPGILKGKTLINLDTEEWGHFYLGCAGGIDVEVRHECRMESLPRDYEVLKFGVTGLRGGHSGIDINLGRGNAIKLLAEAMYDLSLKTDLRLIAMNGGSARNAIPREAFAVCALPVVDVAIMFDWIKQLNESWFKQYRLAESQIALTCRSEAQHDGQVIHPADQSQLLDFLNSCVNGVAQMSDTFSGVVDTSDNLGVVGLAQGAFSSTFKVRSLVDARASALADKLVAQAKRYSLKAWTDGAYPGWTPNPSSELLKLCQQVYAKQFGQPANLQVIHAGLECGLLGASYPHLEMISFGPDIQGAHAPGERVKIESVEQCWSLLKAILQALATDV